jgi:hypothetical protein
MWNQMFPMACQMEYCQTEMLKIKKATQPVTRPPAEAASTRARLRHEAFKRTVAQCFGVQFAH